MEIIKTRQGDIRFKEKVYLTNGKTITKSFFRKTDAVKWKQDIESLKRREPDFHSKRDQNITFEALFMNWMELRIRGKRSKKTIIQYDKFYSKHFKLRFGSKIMNEIKTADVDKFVSYLIELGLKPKSINNVLTLLKQLFKYAVREEFIKTNPSSRVEYVNEPQGDVKYFTTEEIHALMNAHKNTELYPILVVAFNTGLRIGEIFGLYKSAINFQRNSIVICRKATRYGLEEFTKTKRVRYIPMNNIVRKVLAGVIQAQTHPDLVFTNKSGQMIDPDHFSSRDFLKALTKAQVRKLNFHCTRHSYSSHFMMNGGNIYTLQKLLGHSDIKSTMIYAHLSPSHFAEASQIVNFESASTLKSVANENEIENSSPYLALA